ncbi:MAG: nicotinate-nucleotide adenylyltransferase [Acidiferrobacterales bacterium]
MDLASAVVIGILGGTFDPIHYGHLRPTAQVQRALDLEQVRFVPAARPPHRRPPAAAWKHRLQMVQLAVAQKPRFDVDDREAHMKGPSYTVSTLSSMREEFGSISLCLLMGSDAFRGLESWHQWRRLFELAHIVVMARPGSPLAQLELQLPQWARNRFCRDKRELSRTKSGRVIFQQVDPQEISASSLRTKIKSGESVQGLLPDAVWDYIRNNHLYGYGNQGA